jgi:hypothetical protein
MSTPPAYPPTPAGGPPIPPGSAEVGVIGKHRNPLLAWLVWPLITLGIYHLVSWYKINRESGTSTSASRSSDGSSVRDEGG